MINLNRIKTFQQFVKVIAKAYKDKPALKFRPRFRAFTWTYNDILLHSLQIAKELEKRNVQHGDKVLIWSYNSPYWIAAFFGIQLKGAVVVPINLQNTPEFIKKVAKQTNAKLLIKLERLPKIRNLKSLDLEDIPFDTNIEHRIREPKLRENDLAEIVYTSGTTGEPKGVMLTHKNILSNVKASLEAIPVNQDDRFLSILPLSHMFEQVGGMLVPLSAGSQVTYATALNSISIRKNLIDDKITKMLAVPEFLKLIIRRIESQAEEEGKKELLERLFKISHGIPLMNLRRALFHSIIKKFGKLHTVASGGAPLEKEIGEKWESMGIYVLQGYGTTECSPVVSVNTHEDRKIDSVGKPIQSVKVKIADDEEILVKGPNVTQGYLKNPEKTRESFVDDWYRTGDAGYFDQDGHLHIKGRTKYMIVTEGGQNVYPEDIEFELNKMPRIEDSCVIGWKREDKLEIHAVLLGKKIRNPEKIVENVNKKLASFQQIQGYSIWPLDDFPRTVTKKVKKGEVLSYLEKISKGEKIEKEVKEVSIIEKLIVQVTGVSVGKVTDSKKLVADLKMDSLDRVELVSLIEEETGVIIDESEIGLKTTVRDVKNLVEKKIQKIEKHEFKEWPLSPFAQKVRSGLQAILVLPWLSYYAPLKVEGLENLEDLELPAIFFSNHIGSLDAGIIVRALPSHIREKIAIAAAVDTLWEHPKFKKYANFIALLYNAYPFARERTKGPQIKSSLEYTGRLLDRGFSILAFPEGRVAITTRDSKFKDIERFGRVREGELLPFKEGAGFLAVEMQVPVVPVKLVGSQFVYHPRKSIPELPSKHEAIVRFGKPLQFSPNDSYINATKVIQNAVENL